MNKTPSILRFLLTLSFLVNSTFVLAQTYRWVDKEGVTHFTAEAPDPSEVQASEESKTLKPEANLISEKEEYQEKRASLEAQISGTINDERRDQLKRQLLVLDYQWYQKIDPEKAEELAEQLEAPKTRVIKKQDETNNMSKHRAFY
jgi:hypothetical protein